MRISLIFAAVVAVVGVSGCAVDTRPDDSASQVVQPQLDLKRPGAPRLDYPYAALANNLEGRVVVAATITKEGYAVDCAVVSTTNHIFDAGSLAYCSASRYAPGTKGGVPVQVDHFLRTLSYKLREK